MERKRPATRRSNLRPRCPMRTRRREFLKPGKPSIEFLMSSTRCVMAPTSPMITLASFLPRRRRVSSSLRLATSNGGTSPTLLVSGLTLFSSFSFDISLTLTVFCPQQRRKNLLLRTRRGTRTTSQPTRRSSSLAVRRCEFRPSTRISWRNLTSLATSKTSSPWRSNLLTSPARLCRFKWRELVSCFGEWCESRRTSRTSSDCFFGSQWWEKRGCILADEM